MKNIILFLALTISVTVASQNTAPVVSGIPDQSVGPCGTFVSIALDDYVLDDSTADADIIWSNSGNSELIVSITNRVASITLPYSNWYGSETIRFTATDDGTGPMSDFDEAIFTVAQMGVPLIGDITHPTCGVSTGSVDLSGLPASGTWTLTRYPGGITSTGTGTTTTVGLLASGSYTWTVTNAAGCISVSSLSAVVNPQPAAPTAPIIGAINHPTCGVSTGSVDLSGLPASGTWTLTRYPGAITSTGTTTTTTVGGLASGSYTWTVTNAAGCISVSSLSAVVNPQPATPTAPIIGAINHPTCGVSTGSVDLSGLPASGTWTLTRYPGAITSTGTTTTTTVGLLASGSYTWTVTNAAGCISVSSLSAVVNPQPATPTAPIIGAINHPTCGVSTGSVDLSGLPASGTWTLTRYPGAITSTGTTTTTTVGLLASGSYTWTVTNAAGCISVSSLSAVVNPQPAAPTAPIIGTINHPTCGVSTGSVDLSGLPASGTWTLTRYPGGITSTGTTTTTTVGFLASGSYTWTVTNAAGCISVSSLSAVVNPQPATPTAPIIGAINHPTCSVSTGSVDLSGLPASGTWTLTRYPGGITSTGTTTTTTVGLLASGSYTWTVTNAAGCISVSSLSAVVNPQPATPTAPIIGTINHPTCGVSTGSVDLSGLPALGWTLIRTPGGVITNGTGATTTINGLSANSYTWTVTSNAGCISSSSLPAVVNPQPATPTAPIIGAINHPTCGESTGSVALSGLPASGTWTLTRYPGGITSTGTTTTTTVGLLASGSYTWTVTNAAGCISVSSLSAVVNPQPATPTAPIIGTINHPTCGVSTGSVDLSGLPASGTWTLTRYPGGITSTGTTTTTTVGLLASGSYTWTVTNAAGCISVSSLSAVVNPQPATPTAPIIGTINHPTCGVSTGSVDLSGLPALGWTLTRTPGGVISSGTGATTTINGLSANSYTWTVTNAAGCISVSSLSAIVNPQPATPSAPLIGTITHPTCGVSTGSVDLSGLPALGWTLIRTPGGVITSGTGTGTTISGLSANSYTWTVTSAAGCISVSSLSAIVNPQPATPSAPIIGTINHPTCGVSTGSVALSGLPALGWTLIRTPGGVITSGTGTGTTISGLSANSYTWTVTSNAGCISPSSLSAIVNTQPVTPAAPLISDITHPTCGVSTGSVDLSGLPASGTWTLTRSPGGATSTGTGSSTTIGGLATGSYSWTVRNTDGCTSSASGSAVINSQPVTPSAPVVGTITHPTCGVSTGSVALSGLPASGTWTLTRSPGGSTSTGTGTSTTINGLATGSYTWTVRNTDGCTSNASNSAVINTQPVTPSAPVVGTITHPTCGVSTGSVDLSGLPASGTWTLTRSPGGATSTGTGTSTTINGLTSGSYSWTVRNTDGCTSSASNSAVVNTQPVTPSAPQLDGTTQPTCGLATGSVDLSGLPASGTWTLTRSPGGATSTGTGTGTTIDGLATGNYSWTVRNTDGCTSSASNTAVINSQPVTPSAPVVGTITHPTCGVSTGSVPLSGLPASGTWTLTRSPGGATSTGTGSSTTIGGLATGTYSWTVRNTDGCTSSASNSAVINSQPVTPAAPQISSITQPTCGVATGGVVLSGLPSSGAWVLTRYPGGITSNGSGTSLSIPGLNPDAYTFTVTNSVGCTSQASAPVVINLQPQTPTAPMVGTISQPTCYTASGSVVLSGLPASGSWTLTRSPGGITTTGTGTVVSVSGLPAGNYTFVVRNAQGCSSAASNEVRVNSQPSTPTSAIILGDTYTSCEGESILLDAGTGFDSYSWSSGSSSRTIDVAVNGTYSVNVTQGDCSASANANVTFNPLPILELGPTIKTCVGQSVTLNAGAGFDTYRWTTGANSQTINVTQNGTYGVTIEKNNCSASDNVQVIFNSLPLIPLATSYYGTSCITLDAENAGSVYTWNTGASSQTVEACSTGTYSVIVTNPDNCSASGQTSVTIGQKPVVDLPSSLSDCEGESIKLDAGSGFASYLWNTGATSQSIIVSSSGTYSVTVTDTHSEQASDNVAVTFHALPLVNLGKDQSICEEESVQLSAGPGFSSYAWNTGESTQSISVTTAGSYSVTVSDGFCSASDQVNVQVKSLPAVDLGSNISTCLGETVALDAGAGYDAYYWNTGETSSSITVSTPGSYSVNVTDNGCTVIDNIQVLFNQLPEVELGSPISACEGDDVILNAGSGFSSYLWSTGETSQSISVTSSNTYSITVANGNCIASDELDVTFHGSPKPNLGNALTSCEGEIPILDAGPGFVSYLWSTGGTSQTIPVTTGGSYSVSVSDGTCFGSDEVEVAFLEIPVVDLGPSFTACQGAGVILDAGPGFDIYIWSTGETTQTISPTISAEYLVSVNNKCGSTSDGVIVTMKVQPAVDLGEDTWIAAGAELLLDAGDGQSSYHWSTGATESQILLSGLSDGVYSYWVEVTGPNNCQNSDTIVVYVGEGTGIDESFLNRSISIYPNPSEDRFFVRSDGNIDSDITVTIYDAAGRILLLEKWEDLAMSQAREIDISDFKPGIYLVSFYSDKEVAIRKLIKH